MRLLFITLIFFSSSSEAQFLPSTPRPTATIVLPSTMGTIPLFYVFDHNIDDAAQQLTQPRGWVWGATNSTSVPTLFKSFYMTGWRDPCHVQANCPFLPIGEPDHDINWYYLNHPDWVMYACDKVTYINHGGSGYVALDTNSPFVRDYMMSVAKRALNSGYNGINFDNMAVSNADNACGHYSGALVGCGTAPSFCGVWHQDFSDGAPFYDYKYAAAMLDYINAMRIAINAIGAALVINAGSIQSAAGGNNPDMQYSQHLLMTLADGAISEGAYLNGCDGGGQPNYYNSAPWLVNFLSDQAYNDRGYWYSAISYLCNSTLATISNSDLAWVTANFLLVAGSRAFLWVGAGSETGFPQVYPVAFSPAVGIPTGDAVSVGPLVYARSYSNGFVVVNALKAGAVAVTITIPAGSWKDQFGNVVASGGYSLGPSSGLVLVKQ